MLHLFRAVKLALALRKSDELSKGHYDQLLTEKGRKLRAAGAEPISPAQAVHGHDAWTHQLECQDPGCKNCIDKPSEPLPSPSVDYSHLLPDHLKTGGYKLLVTHSPGFAMPGEESHYEQAHATLVGPHFWPREARTGQDGMDLWAKEGYWRAERNVSTDPKHLGNWPSHGAWSTGFGFAPARNTKNGKRNFEIHMAANGPAIQALDHYIRQRGPVAEDDEEKYYSHVKRRKKR